VGKKMRLALVQKDVMDTDCGGWLERVEQPVDLVCFAELATTGALYEKGAVPDAMKVANLLARDGFGVVVGMPLEADGGLYNACVLVDGAGRYWYRKIHLFEPFNEPGVYRAGAGPGICDTRWGRLGLAICYDIRFEEIFGTMADRGVETVFVPSAFPRVRVGDFARLLVEYAGRLGMNMVGINAVGDDGRHEFGGRSMIVKAGGEVVAEGDETSEVIVYGEV
jgi:omega-amidase